MNQRPTISADEAARILGVSKSTITRLIQRGELEAYKLTLGQTSPCASTRTASKSSCNAGTKSRPHNKSRGAGATTPAPHCTPLATGH